MPKSIPILRDLSGITVELAKDSKNFYLAELNAEGPQHPRLAVLKILRRWIDAWLDTGLGRNMVEVPSSRGMSIPHPDATTAEAEAVGALFDFTQKWCGVLPGIDGRPHWSMAEFETIYENMKSDEDEAKFYLAIFMLSPLLDYVAKCRQPGCGRYFALRQTNREYIGGTLCSQCVSIRERKQSAESMNKNRTAAETKLYGLLATNFSGLLRDEAWSTNSKLRKRMVVFVNREISKDEALRNLYRRGSRIGITPSWFSREANQLGVAEALANFQAKRSFPQARR